MFKKIFRAINKGTIIFKFIEKEENNKKMVALKSKLFLNNYFLKFQCSLSLYLFEVIKVDVSNFINL